MLTDYRIRPLVWLLYLAAATILVHEIMDLVVQALASSPDPGFAPWRFRFTTLVSGKLGWFLLADAFLLTGFVRLEHRLSLRTAGWIHVGLTPLAGLALLVLVRDIRTLNYTVANGPVALAGVRTGVPLLFFTAFLGLMGFFALRASQKPKWSGRGRPAAPLFTDTARPESPQSDSSQVRDRAGASGSDQS